MRSNCLLSGALVLIGTLHAQQPAPSLIGWQVAIASPKATLFAAVDQAAAIGARAVEGHIAQQVDSTPGGNFDWRRLAESDVAQIRQRIRSKGVTMPAYYAGRLPDEEQEVRKLFRFAKALGVDTVVGETDLKNLEMLDTLATEAGINVAIRGDKALMPMLEGRSARIGISIPLEADLQAVKERILTVHLGSGTAETVQFVRELHRLGIKPALLTVDHVNYSFLMSNAIAPILGERMDEVSRQTPIRWNVKPEEREKIAAAVPTKAPAKPQKARKLLVIDLNAAYGGHGSIPHFNIALDLMAKNTGAFEAVFNNDLANLRWNKLREYDALYLNNTVGPIFNAPEIRESLLRFVREGGGLAGHHGTGRTSLDWPEFAEMLGGYCGPHGDRNEKVMVKLDDPQSPINAMFGGKSFEFTDEYFRFPTPPYSREKLHVLLSFDVAKTNMEQSRACRNCARDDQDYAISWIRNYGKGRVFYTSFGNAASVFMVPQILEHFLAGIQFALGDLKADATPSAQLSSKK